MRMSYEYPPCVITESWTHLAPEARRILVDVEAGYTAQELT